MDKKQSYQPLPEEMNLWHLECVEHIHNEAEKRYDDNVQIIKLSRQEYPQWDKFKGVLGYQSIRVLHDPNKAMAKLESKKGRASVRPEPKEEGPVEGAEAKFQAEYLGETGFYTREELKEILNKHEIAYFKGKSTPDLIDLIKNIEPEV